jgi:uncharacterized membrane protein YfcA
VAATLFLLQTTSPGGGGCRAAGRGSRSVRVNFLLGALMEVGVGLYGPCLILVSLLGMNPQAAFPIMMGSCAFLMPIGSLKFIRRGRYSLRASLGLGLGGVPAVLIAAFVVKSMPLAYLRWLVVAVVLYAAFSMLRSAGRVARPAEAGPAVAQRFAGRHLDERPAQHLERGRTPSPGSAEAVMRPFFRFGAPSAVLTVT